MHQSRSGIPKRILPGQLSLSRCNAFPLHLLHAAVAMLAGTAWMHTADTV